MDNYKHTNTVRVNGFCLANDELLFQIKDYFGLRSPLELLRQVQRHFAAEQRREPSSDELLLIDAYLTSPPTDPAAFLLTELETDDRFIGETYDDIRRKCKESELKKSLPLNLSELFSFGTDCLGVLGKVSHRPIFSGEDAILTLAMSQRSEPVIIASEVSAAVADTAPASERRRTPSADSLVYVFPASPEMSERQFTLSLASLILADRTAFAFGDVEPTQNGFLEALLTLADGAYIESAALPDRDLVGGMRNGALVTLSGASAAGFAASVSAYGMDARICGRVDRFRRLTVSTGDGIPMTLSTEFLRKSRPKYSLKARIPSREPERSSGEGFAVIGGHSFESCTETARLGSLTVTALGRKSLSFADAVLCLTEGVSHLVAAGVPYTDITASLDLSLTASPNGDGVAALLGLYRVQAELGLVSVGNRLSLGEGHFGVTLAGKATAVAPDTHQGGTGRVYLLAPRTDGEVLPNFSDLRHLFEYVTEGIRNGSIVSARAVGSAGIGDTLKSFVGERAFEKAEAELPDIASFGFVAEAKDELDGLLLGVFQ